MDTLLIIDMQQGPFASKRQWDAVGVIERINKLSTQVREQGGQVIFIQHDGTSEEDLLAGTIGWEIIASLKPQADDRVIRKTTNDAFYHTDLNQCLLRIGAERLIIAGWATDFCVDSTIRSALGHDYFVRVAADCHTLCDRPHLSAEQVIEHHNWLWANLITANDSIKVQPAASLLSIFK